MFVSTRERLERLEEDVHALVALDPADLDDAGLAEHTLGVRRLVDRLELVFARAAAAAHGRGVGMRDGSVSTAAWLRRHAGLPEGRARAAIEEGQACAALPATAAAWASGDVSAYAARTIFAARVDGCDEVLRACEADLIELARRDTRRSLLRAVRRFRELATDGWSEDRMRERRGLHISRTIDGLVELDATLDGETAEVVLTAVHAFTDPPAPGDARTSAQRRADALRRMAEAALSTLHLVGCDSGAAVARRRPHVTYLVSHDALMGGDALPAPAAGRSVAGRSVAGRSVAGRSAAGRSAETPALAAPCDGELTGPIGRAAMERLLCDAVVSRVVTGPEGVVLDAGRARRVVSGAQRRAVVARDQGCRFPGCDRPPGWCEVHHVRHWLDGGGTDLGNLQLLCDRHHRLAHRGGRIPGRPRDGPGGSVAA